MRGVGGLKARPGGATARRLATLAPPTVVRRRSPSLSPHAVHRLSSTFTRSFTTVHRDVDFRLLGWEVGQRRERAAPPWGPGDGSGRVHTRTRAGRPRVERGGGGLGKEEVSGRRRGRIFGGRARCPRRGSRQQTSQAPKEDFDDVHLHPVAPQGTVVIELRRTPQVRSPLSPLSGAALRPDSCLLGCPLCP